MITTNRLIGCSPFATKAVKAEVKNGLALVQQKTTLTPLTVLFADDLATVKVGETIYVRGDTVALQWAKHEYEIDGVKFVLVPISDILLIKGG